MSHISSIFATVSLITATWIFSRVIYNIYFHPLRSYPGSTLWVATRLTWAHAMQSGKYHYKLHELHARFGPVVRVAPDELSYINPEAWKDIYGNRNIPKNHIWAGQEESHHPVSIVSADEATHLRNRRALTGAFTNHAITEHASVLDDLVSLMLQRFKETILCSQGFAVLDIVDWLNFLTFDISGALAFGDSFKSVASGRAHPWVEISCNFGKGIALMASINFFRPLDKLMRLAMPKKIMEKMQYHKNLGNEKFMQRLSMENSTKALDYVGSIMAYNQEKGEVKIPKEEIEANMTLLIFAGSETTSTAMTAILSQLLRNHDSMEKVQAELRSTFESEGQITISSSAKLVYLTAVIQEGIRMGPPAAIGLPRVIPKGGETISGKHVPAGTFVAVNQYPAFRSSSNFSQANSFIPERFLPNSPFSSDRLDAFEPFLLGRHKCIGRGLAWAMMRLTLAKMLFAFQVEVMKDLNDFGEQKTYIFWEKQPLRVKLQVWEGLRQ